jgi:hypothetical protein
MSDQEHDDEEEGVIWPGIFTRLRPIAAWFIVGTALVPLLIWLIRHR